MKSKLPEVSVVNIQSLSERILPNFLYVLRVHSAFAKERDLIFKNLGSIVGDKSQDISLKPLLNLDSREVDAVSEFDVEGEFSMDMLPSDSAQVSKF